MESSDVRFSSINLTDFSLYNTPAPNTFDDWRLFNIQNTYYKETYYYNFKNKQPLIDRVDNNLVGVQNPDSISKNFIFNESIATVPGTWTGSILSFPNFVTSFFKPDYKTPEPSRLFPSISGPGRVCFRDTATFLGAVRDPKIDSLTWKVYRKDTLVLTSKGTRLSRVFPPGDYHITLTAWRTCVQQSINQNLEVAPDPQININLASKDTLFTCKNSPLVLDAGPRLSYQWQNGSTTQTISATQEGKYTVKGTNACGSASDSVWVSYFQPKIPNIFTPNQDQKNDVFSITAYPNQGGSLKIQDRWGREVYQNENYASDWSADGLPDGIYYYHFQFSTCEPKAGWVQVVR